MALDQHTLVGLIKAKLPDATIEVKDTRGDQDHYDVMVTSSHFKGLTKIQQHKLVYSALGDMMGTTLHAMSVKTALSNGDQDNE